jgi:hypothetical protein
MRYKLERGKVYRLHLDTGERLLGMFIDRTVVGLPRFLFPWSAGFVSVDPNRISQCEFVEMALPSDRRHTQASLS